jgi:protein-S-isoprenylcysteine O-methyltransferase Ste14
MRITALVTVVVLLALGALALIQQATKETTLLVGALLVLVGLALLVLSRPQLGNAFAVAPRAKHLVTHGLYARVPHPMYVFLDVALLGAVLMLRRPWLLVVLGVLVIIHAWQAGREARVLEQAFGDAYRDYRRCTWW